ncbi:hypothetical protein RHA1_ro11104 (plasmid) [Rhodococcus jostii RHA1]|uniref:Uncharacterized protein n=1 Tax=Rhodococcus jostii (strain RHA1) TaxID=101510 RepID=Q0RVD5_RHOJR|nr:hypothetical protein RHA1_ro11104 [Rhodococcus jostii RHA1]
MMNRDHVCVGGSTSDRIKALQSLVFRWSSPARRSSSPCLQFSFGLGCRRSGHVAIARFRLMDPHRAVSVFGDIRSVIVRIASYSSGVPVAVLEGQAHGLPPVPGRGSYSA